MKYHGLILAGGRGSRMGALCDQTPKPMLKIKGRPMIEWILRRYVEAGFAHVFISIRYLASKISDRYGNSFDGMRLDYIVERNALGTAGCIGLLPEPFPLVVSNGDLYTSLDWKDLIRHHESGDPKDATITSTSRVLPYGVIWPNSTDVITERPAIACNAGMYLLESHVVRAAMMASAHKQDMPDLINRVKLFGGTVGVYDIPPGTWADVGTPDELERVNA